MTTTNNNIIVMNSANTEILDASGKVIHFPQTETTSQEVSDFVNAGKIVQHTTFDTNGLKTREAFVKEFGTDLSQITSLEAALKLSGLDFSVKKVPATVNINDGLGMPPRFVKVPNVYFAMREDTREIIGTDLSEDYEIIQNIESFNFLDSLVEDGAKFVTATAYGGSTRKGKERPNSKIMICMEAPKVNILHDEYTPYFMFRNGFDKTISLTCCFVSMRVFCANAINRALRGAQNKISIRHTKTMRDRIDTAHMLLSSNTDYMNILSTQSELMALKPFTENEFNEWITKLVPINDEMSPSVILRKENMREALMVAYRQDDLNNYSDSAYRAIQAVSDFESHFVGQQRGSGIPTSFRNIVEKEMPLLNKTWDMLLEAV